MGWYYPFVKACDEHWEAGGWQYGVPAAQAVVGSIVTHLGGGTESLMWGNSEQAWLEQRSQSGCEQAWYPVSGVGADAPLNATPKANVILVGAVVGMAMLATIFAMRGRG